MVEERDSLEDLVSVPLAPGKVTEAVVKGVKAGIDDMKATLGATQESSKLKAKMFSKKPKEGKKEKLPEHIRKAYIVINDKKPNDPISIAFDGEWTGIDINLAGKHLILEYHVFVRDRAIKGK